MSSIRNFSLNNTRIGNSDSSFTALEVASYYGHIDVVRFLLTKGADVNSANPISKYTPLLQAILGGKILVVIEFKELLSDSIRRDQVEQRFLEANITSPLDLMRMGYADWI